MTLKKHPLFYKTEQTLKERYPELWACLNQIEKQAEHLGISTEDYVDMIFGRSRNNPSCQDH